MLWSRGIVFFKKMGGGLPSLSPEILLSLCGGRRWGLAAQHVRCGGRGRALPPACVVGQKGAGPHHPAHMTQGKGLATWSPWHGVAQRQGLATWPTWHSERGGALLPPFPAYLAWGLPCHADGVADVSRGLSPL